MKTQRISNQNFTGRIRIISEFPSKCDRKAIDKAWTKIKDLIKDENFDIFIKKTHWGETIVGTDPNFGYPVPNNDFLYSAKLAIRDKKKK